MYRQAMHPSVSKPTAVYTCALRILAERKVSHEMNQASNAQAAIPANIGRAVPSTNKPVTACCTGHELQGPHQGGSSTGDRAVLFQRQHGRRRDHQAEETKTDE
jgi:hypothetical protein